MKIAYIGANGPIGTTVVPELARRGHQVSAISRSVGPWVPGNGIVQKQADIENPKEMAEVLRDHDVIVSSVQFGKYDHEKLISAVKWSGVARYFVCGGSGTAHAPGTNTRIMDLPTFPAVARGFAQDAARFLDRMKKEKDLDWTFITPPPPPGFCPGLRTGKYRTGHLEMLVAESGKPALSYEDYAVAIADELENRNHKYQYTVGY